MSVVASTAGPAAILEVEDGLVPGQIKYFVADDVFADVYVTPNSPLQFSYVRLTSNGQSVTLLWTGRKWCIVSIYNAIVVV